MKKFTAVFIALFIGAFVFGLTTAPAVNAHDGEDHADEASAAAHELETASQEDNMDSSAAYTYVAQSGDSYTKMARKAVQTFGIMNIVQLTPAQIVYAETTLTREAGQPELNIGESVGVNEAAVRAVVDMAKELDPAVEAQWDYYVQFVNFNTDAVGQVIE